MSYLAQLKKLEALKTSFERHQVATQILIRALEKWAAESSKKSTTPEESKKIEDMANNVANTVTFLMKEMFHVKQRSMITSIK